MDKVSKINLNNNFAKILIGSIVSFFVSIVSLFIYASVLTYTNINENTMKPVVIVICLISILIGSFICSLKIKKSGIFNGICVGFIYSFTLYVLSSIIYTGFGLSLNTFIIFIVSIVFGGLGGIIGVNLK